jgi:hypothetical protein
MLSDNLLPGSILEESIENFEQAQKHISEEGLLHYFACLRISLKFEQQVTGNREPQTASIMRSISIISPMHAVVKPLGVPLTPDI